MPAQDPQRTEDRWLIVLATNSMGAFELTIGMRMTVIPGIAINRDG